VISGKSRQDDGDMAISRFVWLLLFLWAGYQALMCTVSYQLEWDDNSDVRMRYVEHKLLLLKAGERGNGLVRWWTEADRGGDVYRELREVLPDSIPEDGKWLLEVARDVIELRIARAEGRDPPEMSSLEDYNLRYVERRIDYPLYVIEASLHVQVSPELKRYLLESEDEILRRSFISALPEFVLMVLGLLFLPSVIRKGDSRKVESEDGEKSSPWIVLSIFAGASLLAVGVELVAVFAWSFFPYFDGDLGWVGLEFLWRALPALLMALYFFRQDRHLLKALQLFKLPAWKEMIVAFGVVSWLNYPLYYLQRFTGVDPNDFFSTIYPDNVDLLSRVMNSTIAAPLFEEIVFRGFLFCGLRARWGDMRAAIVSTLLFTAVHWQYDLVGLISVGLFGFSACWLVVRTNSLSSAILVHMFLNAYVTWGAWLNYQAWL